MCAEGKSELEISRSPEGVLLAQSHALETSHRSRRPPFIDCTQYLPRPLVAVPVSLVPRPSRRSSGARRTVLRLMRPARTYWLNLKTADPTIERCGAYNAAQLLNEAFFEKSAQFKSFLASVRLYSSSA